MHVVQVSFYVDRLGREPDALLEAWPSLVDVANAAAGAGAEVNVVQACRHEATLRRGPVTYHFVPPARSVLRRRIEAFAPQVLHVHGFGFPREVVEVAAACPFAALLLQDHACRPPSPWRRGLWRRAFAAADGVAFCAPDQAMPFLEAALLRPPTRIYEIPESTSRFSPGDAAEARRDTGGRGDPLVLYVGHLDANKDPLTVLDGVRRAMSVLPGLHLWCCFGSAPLLREVSQRIASDALLRERVHLLGAVEHAAVEQWMRAADLFVSASHREGSGYALIEALACGLPAVVTDIPSFRALTRHGEAGALWRCGDSRALAAALVEVATRPRSALRATARALYEAELGPRALGAKLVATYEDLVRRRQPQRARI
jgi:glycosyltransferase involved in cell wall biosynthesis